MKYFTKHLPVEGEIKEGDHVRRQNSGKVEGPCTDISLLILDKHDQKVKLFLVSRDIQVGDNTFDLDDNYNYGIVKEIIESEAYFNESDLDSRYLILLYKVIGEVSPNAVWVKEGMEFEEKDIQLTDFKFIWSDEQCCSDCPKNN
jgi:hypothetical protein